MNISQFPNESNKCKTGPKKFVSNTKCEPQGRESASLCISSLLNSKEFCPPKSVSLKRAYCGHQTQCKEIF